MFKRLFREHHMPREFPVLFCEQLSEKVRKSTHQVFFVMISLVALTCGSINAMANRKASALLAAVINDNFEQVKTLLKNSAGAIDQRNIKGQTALHLATCNGNTQIVALLIKLGADVNIKDDAGEIPLHVAAHSGHKEVAALLSLSTAEPNQHNSHGQTPLHLACEKDDADIAGLLSRYGANVNIRDDEGSTPLHIAAHGKRKDIVALLLLSGADPNQHNKSGQTPLGLAIKRRCTPVVDLLLEHGADDWPISGSYQTPLERVASHGYVEILNSLLCHPKRQFGVDDEYWNKILHILTQKIGAYKAARICEDLPNFRATKMASFEHPLIEAVKAGDIDQVTLLLRQTDSKKGQLIDINRGHDQFGMTALHWAARDGNEVITRLLLKFGAHAPCNGGAQRSPLHEAVKNRHLAVAMALIEASKANINQKEGLHWKTPLEIAVVNGDETMVQFLLDNDADPNIGNPLYNAVYQGHEGIIGVLLEHGAYVNARNEDADTPLHLAVRAGQIKIIRLLLDHGARVLKKGLHGLTVQCKNPETEQLLKNYTIEQLSKNDEIEQLLNNYRQAEVTPLHKAAQRGQFETLNRLLSECQASIDSQNRSGKTALMLASSKGHVEIVDMLLSTSADVNIRDNKGNTALHHAIMKHHWNVVQILLGHPNIDVDLQNCRGLTPLHCAAMYRGHGHGHEIIQQLTDHGADIAKTDRNGQLPLHYAVRIQPNPETVRLLLEHGIAAKKEDKGLWNTLSCAASSVGRSVSRLCSSVHSKDSSARSNETELARITRTSLVLDAKINAFCIDHRDCKGQTPLHIAAKGYNATVISLLLQHGADGHKRDFDGQTPLQIAQVWRFDPEIIEKMQIRPTAGPEEVFCCGANKRLGAKSPVRMLPRSLLQKIVQHAISE